MTFAHGDVPPEPAGAGALLSWAFEPLVWLLLAAAAFLYWSGARRVRGWARRRGVCFGSGLVVALVALSGPPAVYEGASFPAHMVQHLLLTLVAAPLLVLGAPVSLALRSSGDDLRRRLTRVLHSGVARTIGHPAVAWTAFGVASWAVHYSPLYDVALESAPLHVLEHALLGGTALLFWAPAAAVDPLPRLARPVRVAYLLAAVPVQSFLGLALYSADAPLYRHYATVERDWGPSPLDDQRAAAMVMWLGGDALLLGWTGAAAAAWLRAEEAEGGRADRRLGTPGREEAPPP